MISAYTIGGKVWLVASKVWLVATPQVAQEVIPAPLPIVSVVLEYAEAARLLAQLGLAVGKLEQRRG